MIYSNSGNALVLRTLRHDARRILDVGCGAGDNARIISQSRPCEIIGITHSEAEAELAREHMSAVHVVDLDTTDFSFLSQPVDAIICSHVLEHLKDPATVLSRMVKHLVPGGQVVIAIPNVLELRNRLRILFGSFEYQDSGIMDRTHLRFFNWYTAAKELVAPVPELAVASQKAQGSVPLWFLRRGILPRRLTAWLDDIGTDLAPNLFGVQIVISAVRR